MASIFQGSNCFRFRYLEITLTLILYIWGLWGNSSYGVNGTFSRLDKLNVMWFCGTSEWKYLGDICTMNGATVKMVVLKSFGERGLIDLCAKFRHSQSPCSCFSLITTLVPLVPHFLQIFDRNIFLWISGQFFTYLKQIHKVLLKFEQNLGLNLVILEILNAMDRHKEHMKISKMLSSTPSFRLLEHNTKQRMRISKMQLIVELPRSGCLRALATNFKMTHCAPGDFIIRDFQLPSSSLSSSSI